MAPLIRGSEQAASGVCTPTAGTASGDTLVVFVWSDTSGGSASAPDGTWTKEQEHFDGAQTFTCFTKTLSAAPAANYTFTTSVGAIGGNTITTVNPNGGTIGTISSSRTQSAAVGASSLTSGALNATASSATILSWCSDDDTTVDTPPSSMTEEEFVDLGSGAIATYTVLNANNATYTNTLTWTAVSVERICIGVTIPYTNAGPTIDTQPTAQTARLHGDATTAASFTVAATASGGSLTYQWQLEDSVGGGTYSNLSNGTASGITWANVTAATVTATCTTTAQSLKRVRCNVTDSNGTTTTNAVALTILTGPVLSAYSGVSNGSGQVAPTYTSDDALTANGELLIFTITDLASGEVGYTTGRPS